MNNDVRVRSTPPFKLKDKPTRQYQGINIKKQFGFYPEIIIIEKVLGHSNTLIIRAVLTEDEIQKENKAIADKKAQERKLRIEKYKNGKSSTTT